MAGKKKGDFKPRKIQCPECKGKGFKVRHYRDKNGISRTEEITCTNCDGEGEIG